MLIETHSSFANNVKYADETLLDDYVMFMTDGIYMGICPDTGSLTKTSSIFVTPVCLLACMYVYLIRPSCPHHTVSLAKYTLVIIIGAST